MLCRIPPVVKGRNVLCANVCLLFILVEQEKNSSLSNGMAIDGRIVLGVLATPFIYGGLKSAYWSNQLRKLSDREVLSERYVVYL